MAPSVSSKVCHPFHIPDASTARPDVAEHQHVQPELVSSPRGLEDRPPPSALRLLPYSRQRWSFLIYDAAVDTH